MTDKSPLDKYIAAGMAFGEITRKRAQEMVREVLGDGEASREQVGEWIEEALVRSRRAAEQLTEIVRAEVRHQVDTLGLVSKGDLTKVLEQLASLVRRPGEPAAKAPAAKTAGGTAKKAGGTAKTAGGTAKKAGGTAKKAAGSAKKAAGTAKKAAPKRAGGGRA